MNLLIRKAERELLVRALVAFGLIVAILIAAVASANAAPTPRHRSANAAPRLITCNDRGCFETTAPVKSAKSIQGKRAKAKRAKQITWSFGSGDLVSRARQYLGTNPTGWRSLWCGRFMAMISPNGAAQIRNPNMARDWATLPRVSPQIGAIAVLSRGRSGGHVGVVTGFDSNGNPTIVSGNHGGKVGEGEYPKGRVIAYVMP
jgi:uncharacterized protein (TIGR02594 family)